MGKIFDTEGPVMSFLGRIADLIWLNILMIICCIPVITAGASITAMYTLTIKMVMKEEGYITKGFFKAFKENFKQATIIWLLVLLAAFFFYGDYRIVTYSQIDFPKIMVILLMAVFLIAYSTYLYLFPLLARYENTIKNTIKNAFLLSLSNFPKTVLIILIQCLPAVALYFFQAVIPLILMLGGSLVAYISSMLFVTIFKKLEAGNETAEDSAGESE
ncbi:MAG: DUF624 domain-containing protein [Lachnospiraceae bacterium]|nr:DUF624 domain-containing protein [Lachnospiraceae bacterium]